jgi:hypothetical protein
VGCARIDVRSVWRAVAGLSRRCFVLAQSDASIVERRTDRSTPRWSTRSDCDRRRRPSLKRWVGVSSNSSILPRHKRPPYFETLLKSSRAEPVALIPQCEECRRIWLPDDAERWHAYWIDDAHEDRLAFWCAWCAAREFSE